VSSLERYSRFSGILAAAEAKKLLNEVFWLPSPPVAAISLLLVCVGMLVFSSSPNDPNASSCSIRIERRKCVSADPSNQKRERNFAGTPSFEEKKTISIVVHHRFLLSFFQKFFVYIKKRTGRAWRIFCSCKRMTMLLPRDCNAFRAPRELPLRSVKFSLRSDIG